MLSKTKKIVMMVNAFAGAAVLSVVGVGANNSLRQAKETKALGSYNLSLTSMANKLTASNTETSGSIYRISDYPINIRYSGYSLSEGNWGALSAGGYFYNTTIVDGMASIVLTLAEAASVTVYWSNSVTFNETDKLDYNTASITCSFNSAAPGYFKVVANAAITITSATINYSCTAKTYAVGDAYTLGYYPQAKVTDETLISTLNGLGGTPTLAGSDSSVSWTDYDYYASGSNETAFMWYADVTSGGSKYRGVYLSNYRPANCIGALPSTDTEKQATNQYKNGFTTLSSAYWFKFEPIKWKVLSTSKTDNITKLFLLSSIVVDSQQYYKAIANRTINESTIYSNNYKESDIRSWLNSSFLNLALNGAAGDKIVTSTVDNSAASTSNASNAYVCDNTSDKIFLPSYKEITNTTYGFLNDQTRQLKSTDYAKSQGAFASSETTYLGNATWRYRSPYENGASYTRQCNYSGSPDNSKAYVYDCSVGISPAMWVTL